MRERPDDIPILAEFFAAKHGDAIGRKILGISAGAIEKLTAFDYPGNIRELENEIRRMVALAKDGEYLTTQLMSPAILAASRRTSPLEGYSAEGTTLKDQGRKRGEARGRRGSAPPSLEPEPRGEGARPLPRRPRQQDQAL